MLHIYLEREKTGPTSGNIWVSNRALNVIMGLGWWSIHKTVLSHFWQVQFKRCNWNSSTNRKGLETEFRQQDRELSSLSLHHHCSDPEANRPLIGPSGRWLLRPLAEADLMWPQPLADGFNMWPLKGDLSPPSADSSPPALRPPPEVTGERSLRLQPADWLVGAEGCGLTSASAARTEQLRLSAHTVTVTCAQRKHRHRSAAFRSQLTQHTHTHKLTRTCTRTLWNGQNLNVIVNQRDMRESWWEVC